jgi:hypothetical protein
MVLDHLDGSLAGGRRFELLQELAVLLLGADEVQAEGVGFSGVSWGRSVSTT